jgi:nitroreductase
MMGAITAQVSTEVELMETWDAIRARRNVRDYEDRPIPDADLERVLEAGRIAPSSRNGQPWDFVVVTERGALRELARVWDYGRHVARSAATVALVLPAGGEERKRATERYDLGQATMAMMLAAADLGIGSGHSAVGDQDLARRLLGLPPDREAAYLLALGYPADRPLRPLRRFNRRPFADVVHRERW